MANLVPSEEVAFRVKFQKLPQIEDGFYWRSLVLTRYDGSRWRPVRGTSAPPAPVESRGEIAEYSVDLEPTGQKYLPALELPLEAPEGAEIRRGFSLRREEEVTSRVQYSLSSATNYRTGTPRPEIRSAALRLRPGTNPRTRDLVRRLEQRTSGPRELVAAVMERFAEGDYIYTRNPALLPEENPVDHFLFQSREGFCGHYAQALAWTARAAGIPARIVTGYLGGSRNPLGDYWLVRQSDAHAWVEVYLPDAGWVRKDPTQALSPDQVVTEEEGGASADEEARGRDELSGGILGRAARYAGLAWDAANFGWNYYVLGFTQQRQLRLLSKLRLGDSLEKALPRAALLLTFLFLAFMLILVVILLGKRGKAAPLDRIYRRFRNKLRRAGIEPRPEEGPLSLSRRIEAERPELARSSREILDRFMELRYAGRGDRYALRDFRRRVRRFSPSGSRRRVAPHSE